MLNVSFAPYASRRPSRWFSRLRRTLRPRACASTRTAWIAVSGKASAQPETPGSNVSIEPSTTVLCQKRQRPPVLAVLT